MKRRLMAGFLSPLLILTTGLFVADMSPGGNGLSGPAVGATSASSRSPVSARILGTARVGEVLVGALKGPKPKVPRTPGFQWQACDWRGGACSDLDFAHRQRYRVRAADLGATLRVQVTISTPARTRIVIAQATPVIQGAADPMVAAAGDIACDPASSQFAGGLGSRGSCRQKWTSDILVGSGLSAVLPLGDLQYECGAADAFSQSYEPSWGRVRRITRPALGNHEYGRSCESNDATGYFQYFGTGAGSSPGGWYSYDIGSWHWLR